MILVVGGQGAGKRGYVRELGFADEDIGHAPDDGKPVLVDLHLLLRETDETDEALEDLFETLLRKRVVVCNEIGCGIVPMEASERAWRDRVGRMCARLAAKAERVVRVCCGIPTHLKG